MADDNRCFSLCLRITLIDASVWCPQWECDPSSMRSSVCVFLVDSHDAPRSCKCVPTWSLELEMELALSAPPNFQPPRTSRSKPIGPDNLCARNEGGKVFTHRFGGIPEARYTKVSIRTTKPKIFKHITMRSEGPRALRGVPGRADDWGSSVKRGKYDATAERFSTQRGRKMV